MSQEHQWDLIAAEYASVKDDVRRRFLHPAIEDVVKNFCHGARSLLDYGCGPGDLSLQLAPYFEHITLTDISPIALNIAHRLLAGRAEILSLEQLSASQESYDVVLLSLVLTTIAKETDVLRVLSEGGRRLTPAGHLIVATSHPCFTFRAINAVPYNEAGGAYKVPIGPDLEVTEYHWPLDDLLNAISAVGLQITRAQEVFDKPEYYEERNEEPHRFAGILPMFLILVCQSSSLPFSNEGRAVSGR